MDFCKRKIVPKVSHTMCFISMYSSTFSTSVLSRVWSVYIGKAKSAQAEEQAELSEAELAIFHRIKMVIASVNY